MTLLKKFSGPLTAVALVAVMAVSLLGQQRVASAAAAGTGGAVTAALSTNAATGTGVYTAVANIVVTEGLAADIPAASGTSTIAAPAGWEFEVNTALTVTGGGADITAKSAAATATTITLTVTAGGVATVDVLTIAGVKIRPLTSATAAGPTNGAWADGTMTIVGLAGDVGVAATATTDTGNYIVGGSGIGATSTATKVGSTVTTVTAAGTGITGATFQTSAGTFAANGAATIYCGEASATCDQAGTGFVTVGLVLPSSGTATVTITPAGVGTVSTITVTTTTAPGPVASASASAASVSVVSTAGTSNATAVTFTFLDANGAVPATGSTVSISSNLGTLLCDGTGGTTALTGSGSALCTGALPTTGTVSVKVTAQGVAGAGTITATVGAVSATKAFTITGAVSTVTAVLQFDRNGGADFATGDALTGGTPASASFTAGVRIAATAKDSAGAVVRNTAPTVVTVAPATCATVGALTGEAVGTTWSGNAALTVGTAAAGTACVATVTYGTGTTAKTTTVDFVIGGALATTNVVTIDAVDAVVASAQPVTVTVKDSSGNLVADGTTVTLVASGGALVATTAQTSKGVASFTFVAPGTAQQVGLTAVITVSGVTTVSGSKTITISATAPTPTPTPATGGVFTGTIAPSGLTIVSFTGTNAQLSTAGAAAKVISASATSGGTLFTFVIGAPDFVNVAFVAAFPSHTNTLMIVKTGS